MLGCEGIIANATVNFTVDFFRFSCVIDNLTFSVWAQRCLTRQCGLNVDRVDVFSSFKLFFAILVWTKKFPFQDLWPTQAVRHRRPRLAFSGPVSRRHYLIRTGEWNIFRCSLIISCMFFCNCFLNFTFDFPVTAAYRVQPVIRIRT